MIVEIETEVYPYHQVRIWLVSFQIIQKKKKDYDPNSTYELRVNWIWTKQTKETVVMMKKRQQILTNAYHQRNR